MNQKNIIKAILTLLFTLNTVQAELLSTYTFTDAIGNEATFEPDNLTATNIVQFLCVT